MAVQLLHADAFQMGLLSTLENAAFLLVSLPAGALVDRWRKKTVIVTGDLLRAGLLLTLPLAWLLGGLTLPQLYAVAACVGIVTVFFDVANQSYLPQIVSGKQIGDGNGKLMSTQELSRVIGPSAAAALAGWIGAPLTVALTSVCMGLSSLSVSRIRKRERPPERTADQHLLRDIREGLSFVVRHPLLRRIAACTGLANFASSAAAAISVLYILTDLGLPQSVLGAVMSVGAVGGILGALSAGPFQRIVGEGRAIPLAAVLSGLSLIGLPLASHLPAIPTLAVEFFLTSWAVVVYNVAQVSFRQRLCPPRLLGRMNASIRFLVWGPMPLGSFIGGALGHALGLQTALWLAAAGGLVSALPVLLSRLIAMRELPREFNEHAERDRQ